VRHVELPARSVSLDRGQLSFLKRSVRDVRVLATERPGVFDVELGSSVGVIGTPEVRFHLGPKVPISRVLFLLAYLGRWPEFTQEYNSEKVDDIVDAMTSVYSEALARALRGGVWRDYKGWREELPSPRGRIDPLHLQTRRFGVVPPISCAFDEFTIDVELNRRLLAASTMLVRLNAGGTEPARRLRRLMSRFEGVERVRYQPSRLSPVRLDRRNRRYSAALGLADTIISQGSVDLSSGRTRSVGFLVNMDELYERFVIGALGESLGLGPLRWRPRHRSFLDAGEQLQGVPDCSMYGPDGARFAVLDAKYKYVERPSHPDIYQMVTYCVSFGCSHGVLLYAGVGETHFEIKNSGVTVHAWEVNPDGEPALVKARVGEVARRLRELVGE